MDTVVIAGSCGQDLGAGLRHRIEHQVGPQDATVVLAGEATVAGFRLMSDDLVRDPAVFHRGAFLLIDFTHLDPSGMSPEDWEAAAEPLVEQDWQAPAAAVAYLAPDEQTRRAATLLRAYLGGSNSRRVIFATRADALDWLHRRRDSGDSGE